MASIYCPRCPTIKEADRLIGAEVTVDAGRVVQWVELLATDAREKANSGTHPRGELCALGALQFLELIPRWQAMGLRNELAGLYSRAIRRDVERLLRRSEDSAR